MRNRAFTLIELLVVIGIIALLASIAMPAYRSAQERARATQDGNNLHQIGIGFVAYLNDHEDTITTGTTWAQALGPNNTSTAYVPDYHVFQSPFDKRPAATNPATGPLSYGMNHYVLSAPPQVNGYPVTTVTSYTNPSSLLMVGPADTKTNSGPVFNGTMNQALDITPGALAGTFGNYTIMNVLYADWHVGTVTATAVNAGYSTTNTLWNPVATTTTP